MTDCAYACGTSSCADEKQYETTPAKGVSRRNMLRGLAAGLAAVGLSGAADTAFAASKKITVGKTSDIKVGSARIYNPSGGQPVLITQPKKGVFKAFSPYCTHQRTPLDGISGSNLTCSRHGASFNMTTGAVTGGPTRTNLPKFTVSVSGTSLIVQF